MPNRKLLVLTVILLIVIGAIGSSVPLLSGLPPNEVALARFQKEIDISHLAPGELLEAQWFTQSVFVLRRTPAQIEFLKTYEPPRLYTHLANEEQQNGWGGHPFRSIDPEYFVFSVWKDRQSYLLREAAMYNVCKRLEVFPGRVKTRRGIQLEGAIYCAEAYGRESSPADTFMAYDLSGRSIEVWVAPITVPPYSIKPASRVTLGPST